MLLIEKTRTRPSRIAGSTDPIRPKRSFSRKSAAAVGKRSSGCPQWPYETIGMGWPSVGLCQPSILRFMRSMRSSPVRSPPRRILQGRAGDEGGAGSAGPLALVDEHADLRAALFLE